VTVPAKAMHRRARHDRRSLVLRMSCDDGAFGQSR